MTGSLRLAMAAWALAALALPSVDAESRAAATRDRQVAQAGPTETTGPAETPFAQRMTGLLAADAGRAGQAAEAEIVRLRNAGRRSDQVELAGALWIAAQAAFRTGSPDDAEQHLAALDQLTVPAAVRQWRNAQAALLRGLMARGRGEFGAALLLYRRAQQGFIRTGDRRGQGQALQALGNLYVEVGDGEGALRYLNLARETYDGDDLFQLTLFNNLGAAHQSIETPEAFAESDRVFGQALAIAERLGNAPYARHIRLNMAASELKLGRYELARSTLAQLGPPGRIADPVQRSNAFRILARIAEEQGRLGEAERLIREALRGVDPATSGSAHRPVHFAAYLVFSRAGKVEEALVQLEAVRRIDEADAQLIASNRAALLAAQFQFDAQEARIDRLKAEQLERDIANERTRSLIIVISALAVGALLAGLLWLAIRSRNRARRDGEALAVVNTQLEGALAAKTEFLASTSHEIRTPLNGILGMTQIMLADSGLPDRMRAQVELVHDAGTTMRALVDDILDVAKMEHGGFSVHARPTDVGDLVRRITRLYDAQAQDRGLALQISVAPDIGWQDVDPDRLTQIVFNLVGNAMKFTHQGGITVTLSSAAGDTGQRLVLSVADTGIGIAPEWHDAVFEMFRQVDGTRTRNYGGTGLGLAICRQLAQAMGGDITLDSAEGVGSTFRVILPWLPVDQPAVKGRMAVPSGLADRAPCVRRVLVVGADLMRSSMLAAIARDAGFEAVVVRGRQELGSSTDELAAGWLVDAHALESMAGWAEPAAPLSGRVILAGGDGTQAAAQAKAALLFKDLVTCVAFSRNMIVSELSKWGEQAAMAKSSPMAGLEESARPDQNESCMPRRQRQVASR